MTEQDYLKATNRAKVSAAIMILRDVLPSTEYGISFAEYDSIMGLLGDAQIKLFASYELDIEE